MTIETLTDEQRRILSERGGGTCARALRCIDQRDALLKERDAEIARLTSERDEALRSATRWQELETARAAQLGLSQAEASRLKQSLSDDDVFNLRNGIAPTSGQRRAVTYIEQRDALLKERDAEIARLQVLADSRFVEASRLTEALADKQAHFEIQFDRAEAAEQKLAAAEKSRLEWRADVIEWRARAEAAEQKLAAAERDEARAERDAADRVLESIVHQTQKVQS